MGKYLPIRKLASGGMAEVYLGKVLGEGGFEKPVALKRMLPEFAKEPAFVELFLREARLTASLRHPNIVQVIDLGLIDGHYMMVMELVEGENLRFVLNALRRQRAPVPPAIALYLLGQIADALAHAHERRDPRGQPMNLVHGDISPANVLLGRGGEVKLLDFGVAQAADRTDPGGVFQGKPGYVAPEHVKAGKPVQASDLFVLGVIFYEMIAGKQLIKSNNAETALKEALSFDVSKVERPSSCPQVLWELDALLLHQDPARRWPSARSLADRIRGLLLEARLNVSARDVAQLFTQAFPDWTSPLDLPAEPDVKEATPPKMNLPPPRTVSLPSMPAAVDPASVKRPGAVPPPPPNTSPPPFTGPTPPPFHGATPPPLYRPTPPPMSHVTRQELFGMGPLPGSEVVEPGTSPILTGTLEEEPAPAPAAASPAAQPAAPAGSKRRLRLGEILLQQGKITSEQLELALLRQKRMHGTLGEHLVEEGAVTETQIAEALSQQTGMPFISDERLVGLTPPRELVAKLDKKWAQKELVVPLGQKQGEVLYAAAVPDSPQVVDTLRFALGIHRIRGVIATPTGLRALLARLYGEDRQVNRWSSGGF